MIISSTYSVLQEKYFFVFSVFIFISQFLNLIIAVRYSNIVQVFFLNCHRSIRIITCVSKCFVATWIFLGPSSHSPAMERSFRYRSSHSLWVYLLHIGSTLTWTGIVSYSELDSLFGSSTVLFTWWRVFTNSRESKFEGISSSCPGPFASISARRSEWLCSNSTSLSTHVINRPR